jgi:hypothetical protein
MQQFVSIAIARGPLHNCMSSRSRLKIFIWRRRQQDFDDKSAASFILRIYADGLRAQEASK